MRVIAAILATILIAACGPEVRLPGSAEPAGTGVAGVIQHIAIAAAAIGSIGIFLAGLILVFVKDFALAFKVAIAAVAIIIAAAILHWLGTHLALAVGLCIAVAILAGAAWLWVHRAWVVARAEEVTGKDLDRNGTIGQTKGIA